MVKELELKVSENCEKCHRRAMEIVAGSEGVTCVRLDRESGKMIVFGEVDPVGLTSELRKFVIAKLVSVGPSKNPKTLSRWSSFLLLAAIKMVQKKVVLEVTIDSESNKRKVLQCVAGVAGVEGVYYQHFDGENYKMTVLGGMDPLNLLFKVRKIGTAKLLSVGHCRDRAAQFNFTPASGHTHLASSSTSTSTTSNAYSSTSAPTTSSYVYDVFVNHRGSDTKKGLASHLYYRLTNHGYRVFLDSEEMQGGEKLTPQIEGSIRTASVHIAIFSPRYAESEWCLNELVLMLEMESTILPVFYGTQPSDLRWTQGAYGLALSKLEQKKKFDSQTNQEKPRYKSTTVEKWREALSDVAEISGFELEAFNRNEGQLAEKVVQQVLKKVRKTPLNVAEYPSGLDDKVKDFERTVLLQMQSQETRVIGIVGPGGIGKTTLAKKIFNIYLSNYKKSCFVPDVREKSLVSSQSIILRHLAELDRKIEHVASGIEEIKMHLRLSSGPVLLILDDVNHVDQLNALLAPVRDTQVQSGSLILITSRNKDVLTNSGIGESSIYNQRGLNYQHSRELFCSHAFAHCNPVIEFEEMVENFLISCDGLPLSLKVLGALLRGKDLEYWKARFRRLSKILPDDILNTLKISYDALEVVEKQIFLDCACFFIGEERDTVIRIWDASEWEGRLGLENLESRCLLEVDGKNHIRMHDHLRDLGRYLAEEEPREGLRLWHQPNNRQLSDKSLVRGISMADGYGQAKWSEQSFKDLAGSCLVTNMRRLQLLRAEGSCVKSIFTVGQPPLLRCLTRYNSLCSFQLPGISVPGIFRARQPSQLLWLCWYDCPYSFLPSWIPVQNLRVLHIRGSKLTTLWSHESKAPLQLRELKIKALRFKIPKSIEKLKNLQKFVLHGNRYRDAVMETLPEEFCHLQSLEHLEIKNSKMKSLPHSFGKLTNLQCIHLSDCSNLKMLPGSFGDLTKVQRIHLSLSELKMLPASFGNLTNLRHVDLSWCSKLKKLPESFGNLTNLRHVDLSRCSKLKTLPESFGNLKNLQHIDLACCCGLCTLPDIFGNLTNLQHIELCNCFQLKKRPISLEKLIKAHHKSRMIV